jgi:CBS domain containing-hemolysin-like protein
LISKKKLLSKYVTIMLVPTLCAESPTQAMTPIENVFMLSIDSKLDYDLLKKICQTGHSRVPVYEEVEVPVEMQSVTGSLGRAPTKDRTIKVKKIVGILLVKQCVMLDPNGTCMSLSSLEMYLDGTHS